MTEWPFDALFYVYLCIAKRIKAAIKRVKSRMKFELFRAEAGSSESSNSSRRCKFSFRIKNLEFRENEEKNALCRELRRD